MSTLVNLAIRFVRTMILVITAVLIGCGMLVGCLMIFGSFFFEETRAQMSLHVWLKHGALFFGGVSLLSFAIVALSPWIKFAGSTVIRGLDQ